MEVDHGLSMISAAGSTGGSIGGEGSSILHGYELLLLRKFQADPGLADLWREKLINKASDDTYDLGVSAL